jgi:hypothetical protein
VIFWVAALYVAGVGFYSIPMQVFAPEASAEAPAADCQSGVAALRAELLARASQHVAGAGIDEDDTLRGFFEDWDRRHAALAPLCDGPGERAHTNASRMRHRVEDALRRFTREQAPINHAIDEELRELSSFH